MHERELVCVSVCGPGAATLALCDVVITIPGGGRVQSLNVAAAAVLLYALTAA